MNYHLFVEEFIVDRHLLNYFVLLHHNFWFIVNVELSTSAVIPLTLTKS